jgi:hypothetical protein
MTYGALEEPVLAIAFNRPKYFTELLTRLRTAAPQRLYIAVDGARASRPDDEAAVQACRDLTRTVDWPCEVRTLFQSQNLGCGAGVTAAITWFLENEERGIILEDDILPDPTFFPYCAALLERFAEDDRVFAISGCNLVPPEHQTDPELPYRFSQVPHIWGWAAWRRTWQNHRLELGDWQDGLDARTLWDRTGQSLTGALTWGAVFEMVSQGLVDTWDAQLVYASMQTGQWTATCNVNLTENVGSEGATHENATDYDAQPVRGVRLPLVEVPVVLDHGADRWTRTHHFQSAARARQAMGLRSSRFRDFVDEVRQLSRESADEASRDRYSP